MSIVNPQPAVTDLTFWGWSRRTMEEFEQDALRKGVNIQSYHTDNGIFKSKTIVQEVLQNTRAIRYSGVGAKWHNGVAEGAVSIVAS